MAASTHVQDEERPPSRIINRLRKMQNVGLILTILLVALASIVALNSKDERRDEAIAEAGRAEEAAEIAREQAEEANARLRAIQHDFNCYRDLERDTNIAILALLGLYRTQPTPEQVEEAYAQIERARETQARSVQACDATTTTTTTPSD